jgi:small basic protein
MLALFGLALGALVAIVLSPTVPQDMGRYLAVAVVAAVDAGLGGVRSFLEHTFSDRIFVIAFVTNGTLAVFLVWVGDQLGADLVTAVAVVLGVRIFQNLAAIRRRVFGG